jgi:DNA gyrase subunit A
MKVYEIPEGAKTAKGRAVQNLMNIPKEDRIKAYITVDNLKDPDYLEQNFIVMCTKNGILKKTTLEAYSRPRANGINAITIREGDELLEARLTNGNNEILLAKKSGKAIRFSETTVRPMGRTASGVKGVTLESDSDEVIGMVCVDPAEEVSILVVSEHGYGKRSPLEDYRVTGRGGKGVKTLNITDKTGSLVSIKSVTDEHDLMIINRSGIAIRLAVNGLRVMGRATQGVRLIKLRNTDTIASVARVEHEEEIEEDISGTQIEQEQNNEPKDISNDDNN